MNNVSAISDVVQQYRDGTHRNMYGKTDNALLERLAFEPELFEQVDRYIAEQRGRRGFRDVRYYAAGSKSLLLESSDGLIVRIAPIDQVPTIRNSPAKPNENIRTFGDGTAIPFLVQPVETIGRFLEQGIAIEVLPKLLTIDEFLEEIGEKKQTLKLKQFAGKLADSIYYDWGIQPFDAHWDNLLFFKVGEQYVPLWAEADLILFTKERLQEQLASFRESGVYKTEAKLDEIDAFFPDRLLLEYDLERLAYRNEGEESAPSVWDIEVLDLANRGSIQSKNTGFKKG